MPAPPSVVALPPIASTSRRGPAVSAARSSSPTPRVVAVVGAGAVSSPSPAADASSTTVVPPSVA